MRPDDLRRLLKRQPFCPLRIFVSDGSIYDITHPELAMVVHMSLRIALPPSGIMGSPLEHAIFVSIIHITRVEVYFPAGTSSTS